MKALLLLISVLFGTAVSAQFYKSYEVSGDSVILNYHEFNKADTFKIEGYIADCGEFGGHLEYIKIYKNKGSFFSILSRQHPCAPNLEKELGIIAFDSPVKLTNDKKKSLENYISEFNAPLPDCHCQSNAPTYFVIYFHKKIYNKIDVSGDWQKFDVLREDLFKIKKLQPTRRQPQQC